MIKKTVLALIAVITYCTFTAPHSHSFTLMKYKSTGIYVDRAGGQHPWSISDAHTLVWDADPYMPVGGEFVSAYLSKSSDEEDYKLDTMAIDAIYEAGIHDIILSSSSPLTKTDPDRFQKIIDYLEKKGMRYGVKIDDGPKETLGGYVIAPELYRLAGPYTERTIRRKWPGVDAAIFIVLDSTSYSIVQKGAAYIEDEEVVIQLAGELAADEVLLVYPHVTCPGSSGPTAPDVWTGFDEYRDRLLAYFEGVDFGPGLRFFMEPFSQCKSFTGDFAGFLPDSKGFRLGLEAFLAEKRMHEGAIDSLWGMREHVEDMETAARLMPLWHDGRGAAFAYDRASGTMYGIDINVTRMWRDMKQYRDSSYQDYLNAAAKVLKENVADVPVVFTNPDYHRVYCNKYATGTYDGLATFACGFGNEVVEKYAGKTCALLNESAKATWFVAAGAQAHPSKWGYPDENTLRGSFNALADIGCKAFFVSKLYAPKEDGAIEGVIDNPDELGWLARLAGDGWKRDASEYRPKIVRYPEFPKVGGHIKRIGPGDYWLPSLAVGTASYIGDTLNMYTFAGQDGLYIWSSTDRQQVRFYYGAPTRPEIVYPEGMELQVDDKNNSMDLTVGEEPIVIENVDADLFFPFRTAEKQIERLEKMIPVADAEGVDVTEARDGLKRAQDVMKNNRPQNAHGIAQGILQGLMVQLGMDIWLEGEDSPANSFTGTESLHGASREMALVLDTEDSPPLENYSASYIFTATKAASYEVWVAGSPVSESSDFEVGLDRVSWQSPMDRQAAGGEYAKGLVWTKVANLNISPGRHALTFRVTGKSALKDKYYLAIDAIVVSPTGFTPDGIDKPY